MSDIVLTTLNAKFIHTAFGLRCLLSNMGELELSTSLKEFDINRPIQEAAEALLSESPRILGIGVHIWNARHSLELVQMIKSAAPEIVVVLGGPEVSFETEHQAICGLADYTICGEADLAFGALCRTLLAGLKPGQRILHPPPPPLETLALPYRRYSEADLAQRIVYVEASRGCAFGCEFCLSSLSQSVRNFPLGALIGELKLLLDRGLRHFKFVDRTFNLSQASALRLLEFFLEHYEPGLFLHFEMVPDRFPEGLRAVIKRFPAGSLQFEIGIQSFNPEVQSLIDRRQDAAKTVENFNFLRRETKVHLHADLIVGLPGESFESFGEGFDRLFALGPHVIQIEILKRLRGTPLTRREREFDMHFQALAPYELLRNNLLSFREIQRLRRFSRYFDLVFNSGNFPESARAVWQGAESPFCEFLAFSDWLYERVQGTVGISMKRLARLLFEYLTTERKMSCDNTISLIVGDLTQSGRGEVADAFKSTFRSEGRPTRRARHRSRLVGR